MRQTSRVNVGLHFEAFEERAEIILPSGDPESQDENDNVGLRWSFA